MLLELIFQTFQEHLLDLLFGKTHVAQQVFLRKAAVQLFSGLVQPVQKLLRQFVGGAFHVLEVFQKSTVEFVEICFAFHQNGAAKVIEAREGGVMQPLVQCFDEGHPLIQGDLQPSGTQEIKEGSKHILSPTYFRYLLMVSMSSFFFSRTPAKGTVSLIL